MKINLSQQTFVKSLISAVWTKIAADIFCNEVSSDLLKVSICTLTHPFIPGLGM